MSSRESCLLENYTIEISDSELLAYLYAIEKPKRDRMILAALRIGFLTLSEAKSDIDRQTIRDMTEQVCMAMTQQQKMLENSFDHWLTDKSPFQQALQSNIKNLSSLFDKNNQAGIAYQIQSLVDEEIGKLNKEWSLDEQQSAFSRLLGMLNEHMSQINTVIHHRFDEIKQLQLEQQIRKDEALKGTRHGQVFESTLNEALSHLCHAQGHQLEETGEIPGMIKNCKVGDAVVTLSSDHIAANAKIVIEAKQSKTYTVKKALDEIAIGRKNRQADVGIFIMSQHSATTTWPIFQRYDNDLLVVWDAENPETDIYLAAALSLAIALSTKKQYHASDLPDFVPMQQAVIDLEKQLEGCDEISKLVKTIISNGEKIQKRVDLMNEVAKEKIADLYRCIEQLNQLDIGFIDPI